MPSFSLESIRGCPDCGLFAELPDHEDGVDIDCPRCDSTFAHKRYKSQVHVLAYAIAGFLFCLVLATSPFLDVVFYGRHQTSTLLLGPKVLDQQQLWPLSVIVSLMTFLLPMLKLGLMIAVLVLIRRERPPHFIVPMFRWIKRISPWAMLEVYLLGFLVAYTRLEAMTYIKIDIAVYAMVGAMLSIAAADCLLDKEDVWAEMREKGLTGDLGEDTEHGLLGCLICHQASRHPPGSPCPRCGSTLHFRKKDSFSHAWALLIAAIICYVPANYLPVMEIISFGHTTHYTIIGGIIELKANGLLPLAILVFVASIAIPFLKMLALCYLLMTTHKGKDERLRTRTKIYRVIDFIGRWSMVDIFMISILVALMHFGQLAEIKADPGALYFAAVVILTMIAVESFDIRIMWDSAAKNQRPEPAYG